MFQFARNLALYLLMLVVLASCSGNSPPVGTAGEEPHVGSVTGALTPGAGSLGDCNGNPARCDMILFLLAMNT